MKKMLKIIGIVLLVIIAFITALLIFLSRQSAVADDYIEKIEAGGAIEAKYLKMGPHVCLSRKKISKRARKR